MIGETPVSVKKPALPRTVYVLTLVGPGVEDSVPMLQSVVGVFVSEKEAVAYAADHDIPDDVSNVDDLDLLDRLENQGTVWETAPRSHRRPFGYSVLRVIDGKPEAYARVQPYKEYDPTVESPPGQVNPDQDLTWN
jgi:hypothetical protein